MSGRASIRLQTVAGQEEGGVEGGIKERRRGAWSAGCGVVVAVLVSRLGKFRLAGGRLASLGARGA